MCTQECSVLVATVCMMICQVLQTKNWVQDNCACLLTTGYPCAKDLESDNERLRQQVAQLSQTSAGTDSASSATSAEDKLSQV